MIVVQELVTRVEADLSDAERDLKRYDERVSGLASRAQSFSRSFSSSFLGGLATVGKFTAGLGLALGAVRGIQGVFGFASQGIIGLNSQLDTVRLQLGTLTGSVEQAEEHVRGLFEFARRTPFETGPIIEASRFLQTFGGAALNTRENLTLLGDAAAGTTSGFQDVSFWTGRLFAQLQAGRPFGEAAQRLTELAILTPQARVRMENLREAGASADEIFNVFRQDLERFTGSMERMQTTWQGLTSTFTDSAQLLVSTAFRPLFDTMRRGLLTINQILGGPGAEQAAERFAQILQDLLDRAGQMVVSWIEAFATMDTQTARSLGRIAGFMSALAQEAVSWGANVVDALASGILGAVELVGQAIQTIGDIIGALLAPGSPPRLLPELDTWGAEAANTWLRGWTEADFGLINEVGSLIENILQGQGVEGEGLISRVAGTRSAVADAIAQFRETRSVGAEALERIRDAAGMAADEVAGLVERQFALAEANERVANIERQLSAIQERRQALRTQQRLASIRERIAQGGLSAFERQNLLLEQRELTLQSQLRSAQREQGERQDELSLFRARLNIQQESLSLTERLRDALNGAAGAAKKIGENLAESLSQITPGELDFGPPLEPFKLDPELLTKLDKVKKAYMEGIQEGRTAYDNLTKDGEGLKGALDKLKEALDNVNSPLATLAGGLSAVVGAVEGLPLDDMGLLKDLLLGLGAGLAVFKIGTTIAGIATALSALAGAITGAGGITSILGGLVALLGGPVTIAIGAIAIAVGALVVAWRRDWGGIQTITRRAWDFIKFRFNILKRFLEVTLPVALDSFKQDFLDTWEDIKTKFKEKIEPIVERFDDLKESISNLVGENGPFAKLAGWWDTLVEKAGPLKRAIDKLPFIGDSPSPLEINLKDINTELRELDRRLVGVARASTRRFASIAAGRGRLAITNAWEDLKLEIVATQVASKELLEFWKDDLTRGFEDMRDLIQFDLIPGFERLALDGFNLLARVGEILSDVLREVLVPAMQETLTAINLEFLPGIGGLSTALTDLTVQLGGFRSQISDTLALWRDANAEIVNAIANLINLLNDVIGRIEAAALAASTLPGIGPPEPPGGPATAGFPLPRPGAAPTAPVVIYATVNNDMDLERLALRISEIQQRRRI